VAFACTGAASFLCCDDGDPATELLFTTDVNAKNLYNGTALGVFRCGTEPGEITITVTADGLPPAVLKVEVGGAVSPSCRRQSAGKTSWVAKFARAIWF
jgi:hypothetical protein